MEALAASHSFVAEIDEIQYARLNEGPCITVALEGHAVLSGSLGGDKSWPRFGPRVGGSACTARCRCRCCCRVSGWVDQRLRPRQGRLRRSRRDLGEQFATAAAVAVHNAQVLAQAQELTRQLQTALATRPIIDQAIGLLRGRTSATSEEAFEQLRRLSQCGHTKLVVVAQRLVDQAVRRAG